MRNLKPIFIAFLVILSFCDSLQAMLTRRNSEDKQEKKVSPRAKLIDPERARVEEVIRGRVLWNDGDSDDECRYTIDRRFPRVSFEVLQKLEPLIQERCPSKHLNDFLDILVEERSLPYLDMAIALGKGHHFSLKCYRELTRNLCWNRISQDDFQTLLACFKDRKGDSSVDLLSAAVVSLSRSELGSVKGFEPNIMRVQSVGRCCNVFPVWHAKQLLHCLEEQSEAMKKHGIYPEHYYDALLIEWQKHKNNVDWTTVEGGHIKDEEFYQFYAENLQDIIHSDVQTSIPKGLQPTSWVRQPLPVNYKQVSALETNVVVFDLDFCILTPRERRLTYPKIKGKSERFITKLPHSVSWGMYYCMNLCLHRLIPYFDVPLKLMMERGWRVAYFSMGTSDRNEPMIKDTHEWLFGCEVYENLRKQNQFKVFSEDSSIGRCRNNKFLWGKDLVTTLLPGERLENAVMFEDKPENCHNETQVFRCDLRRRLCFDKAIPGGLKGASACLVGLVIKVEELERSLPLAERIRHVQKSVTVQQLYEMGCKEIRSYYPDADLGDSQVK